MRILELGEVQISLHKIVHVDWLRFCALRNKMANERKGNAGRGQRASQAVREENDHPTVFSPLGGAVAHTRKKKKRLSGRRLLGSPSGSFR